MKYINALAAFAITFLGGNILNAVVGAVFVVAGGLALSACTSSGTSNPTTQAILSGLCVVDGIAQPIAVTIGTAVATANGVGAPAMAAAALDNTSVHPAVLAACAKLGGAVPQTASTGHATP